MIHLECDRVEALGVAAKIAHAAEHALGEAHATRLERREVGSVAKVSEKLRRTGDVLVSDLTGFAIAVGLGVLADEIGRNAPALPLHRGASRDELLAAQFAQFENALRRLRHLHRENARQARKRAALEREDTRLREERRLILERLG